MAAPLPPRRRLSPGARFLCPAQVPSRVGKAAPTVLRHRPAPRVSQPRLLVVLPPKMTTGLILHTGGHCPHPVPLGVGPLGSVTRPAALGRIRLFPGTPVLRGGAEPWWRAGTCPSPPRASWEMPPTRGLCQLPVRGGRWVSRGPGVLRSRTMLPPRPRRAGRLLGGTLILLCDYKSSTSFS